MIGTVQRASWGRRAMIALPFIWLILFFLAPFLIVLKISISEPMISQPPYAPVWTDAGTALDHLANPVLDNYGFLFSDWLYVGSYLTSLKIAAIATLITLTIGYPIAYGIARAGQAWRGALLMLIILPFWTSFLIRVYAWIGILKGEGLLNQFLDMTGLRPAIEWALRGIASLGESIELALTGTATIAFPTELPQQILYTETAVYIGIVYSYLPFMVLPLYANLEKMDASLLEAAADMGAKPFRSFWNVTFPLSLPGVLAGCFLVFIPAVGEFVIPALLGGTSTQMIGATLWSEFFQNRDWPVASAVAVTLLMILVVPIVVFQSMAKRQGAG